MKKLIKSVGVFFNVECIDLWKNSFMGLNFNYPDNRCTPYFLTNASTKTVSKYHHGNDLN